MAGFFARLKTLLQGDNRPVQRIVEVEGLGRLEFSDEIEAWRIDAAHSRCGFGFLIAGNSNDRADPMFRPVPALVEQARLIANEQAAFREAAFRFLDAEIRSGRWNPAEIEELRMLQVFKVALSAPERPRDGEIEFRWLPTSPRFWCCALVDGKPAPHLSFCGEDR